MEFDLDNNSAPDQGPESVVIQGWIAYDVLLKNKSILASDRAVTLVGRALLPVEDTNGQECPSYKRRGKRQPKFRSRMGQRSGGRTELKLHLARRSRRCRQMTEP